MEAMTESKNTRIFNAPAVVVALAGLLIAIHAGLWFAGESIQIWALYAFAFIPARISGSGPFPAILGSQVWSFVTYALLHGSWAHLVFNTLWLVIFGTAVARRLGALKFLLLCAVAAVTGALAQLITSWGAQDILIGASGSISGLLGAAMPLLFGVAPPGHGRFTRDMKQVEALSPGELVRDRRAVTFMFVWLALTLFSGATGWTGNGFADDFRIAWQAHIGGFIGGLFVFYLLDRGTSLQIQNS
jgi:membrane associated rhomboid family serine protease